MSSFPFRLTLIISSALAVAGCANTRPTQQAFAPDDYRERHPLRLEQQVQHIDVFGASPQLDPRQRRDLVEFAKAHTQRASGSIEIATPAGQPHVSVEAIRSALAEGGLRAPVRYSSYPVRAGGGAAPVRVSHATLAATVTSQCGQWPADLAGSKQAETWHNKPYYNLGCAYQTMIAAQVSDPVDLVRPRAEGVADLAKRMKDIEALRKDQDPSTKWNRDDVKITDSKQQ
ncbi:MAG: CpaD family pilus assembly protein [Proteobacteria bacterium]|nr:CpaD family pilus assembly protein [Pseudomonadota bacterium]